MTGVDWPGKLAIHSGCAGSAESGRPVSNEVPFCWGPRQSSQPETAARDGIGAASSRPKRQNVIGIFSFIAGIGATNHVRLTHWTSNLLPRVSSLFYT